MKDFRFSCPSCSQHIQIDAGFAGRKLDCPSCRTALVIPKPTAGRMPAGKFADPEAQRQSVRRVERRAPGAVKPQPKPGASRPKPVLQSTAPARTEPAVALQIEEVACALYYKLEELSARLAGLELTPSPETRPSGRRS